MIQRDYILRIIQDLITFIARMLRLKQNGNLEEAYLEVVKKTEKLLKMDYDDFLALDDTEKPDVTMDGENADYLDACGRFFMLAGEICLDKGLREEGIRHYRYAEASFLKAEQKFKTFSFQRQVELEKVAQVLSMNG
ncbi:hypothetical protein DMA11_19960 [Marinilabiliaceae bacterium JC017]|nr:hypothetical protein DMA11_19960 [Marinilabiliaceae bacterium JC017]